MSEETKKPMPEMKFVGADGQNAIPEKWEELTTDKKLEVVRACLSEMNGRMIGMAKVIRDLVADKQAMEMERKILSARNVKLPLPTKEANNRRN